MKFECCSFCLIQVYGFVSEIVDHGFQFTFKEMGLLVDSGYCVVLFYIYCDFSDSSSNIIATRVQRKLLDLKMSEIETDARKEVSTWKRDKVLLYSCK